MAQKPQLFEFTIEGKLLEGLSLLHCMKESSCLNCLLPTYHLLVRALQNCELSPKTELLLRLTLNMKEKPPLHITILPNQSNLEFITKLITVYSFDINCKNDDGETPLHYALRMKNYELVDCLLSHMKNSLQNYVNNDNLSYFHIACMRNHKNLVERFLENQINVNDAVNDDAIEWPGFTALHFAVMNQNLEIVKLLLKYGVEIDIKNKAGFSAVDISKYTHSASIFNLLSNCNMQDIFENIYIERLCPLWQACFRKDHTFLRNHLTPEFVNETLKCDRIEFDKCTPLHISVQQHCIENVELLLENKGNIFFKNSVGLTPLHLANLMSDDKIVDLLLFAQKNESLNPVDANKLSHLHIASKRYDTSVVKCMLEKQMIVKGYTDVNIQDSKGWTPLHYAVKFKQLETIKTLLVNGADVNIVSHKRKISPLHIAALMNNFEMINLLFMHSHHIKNCTNNLGISHFHIACLTNNIFVVEKFLIQGVPINQQINSNSPYWAGFTALHLAVQSDYLILVDLLLSYGADVSIKNANCCTPIHLANTLPHNHIILGSLLKAPGLKMANSVNKDGLSHFHIACMKCDLEIVEKFIEQGVDLDAAVNSNASEFPGYTALHFAAAFRRLSIVQLLLKSHASVYCRDRWGSTPLHVACRIDDKQICETFRDVLWFLLECDERRLLNALRMNPDYHAASYTKSLNQNEDQVQIVKLLLNYQSYVNQTDYCGRTPIFDTYKSSHLNATLTDCHRFKQCYSFPHRFEYNIMKIFHTRRKKMISLLLKSGAKIDLCDNEGNTLLILAANLLHLENSHCDERVLYEKYVNLGVDVNAKQMTTNMTALHLAAVNNNETLVDVLLSQHVEVNSRESENQATPLHLAALNNNYIIVHKLLNHKNRADVNAVDKNHRTALHNAAFNLVPCEGSRKNKRLTKLLILKGVDVDAQDSNGDTALHLNIKNYQVCIKILLDNGASINVENHQGSTPFMLCCEVVRHEYIFGFVKEIEKMKMIGLRVNQKNEATYLSLLSPSNNSRLGVLAKWHRKNLFKTPRRFSDFVHPFDFYNKDYFNRDNLARWDYRNKWEREIAEMRLIRISERQSLYDVLFASETRMATQLITNRTLLGILYSNGLRHKFRQFYNFLRAQLRRGIKRRELCQTGEWMIERLLMDEKGLPYLCCKQIMEYLTNEDLNFLLRARDRRG